jgi:hypothetical protein
MSFGKSLASLAALVLVTGAVLSAPAIAQDDPDEQNDASLWIAGVGITGAAILGIVLGTSGHENPTPVSP